MKKTLLFALLAITAIPAMAGSVEDHYFGARLGDARSNISNHDVGGSSFDKNDYAAGLFAGYRFSQYLAVEGGWDYLGKHEYNIPGGNNGDVTIDALHLEAVGFYPVAKDFEVFGKLGGTYGFVNQSVPGGHNNERDFGLLTGLGASYRIDQSYEVRGEWNRFTNVGAHGNSNTDGEVDYLGVGVVFHFAK